MSSSYYDPKNHFWIVGENFSRAWSSASGSYTPQWPPNRVTRIANEEELGEVLAVYRLRGPVLSVPHSVCRGRPNAASDFGAVGDGSTDDTPAIQRALDSGIAEINLYKGTYIVSTLIIRSAVAIKLHAGATLLKKSATNDVMISVRTSAGVSLMGVGNGKSVIDNNHQGTPNDVPRTNILSAADYDNITIDGLLFRNSENEAIVMRGCSNVTITNNLFYGNHFDDFAIYLTTRSWRNVRIARNVFDRTAGPSGPDNHPIQLASVAQAAGGRIGSQIVITENILYLRAIGLNCGISVFSDSSQFPCWGDIVIADNIIHDGLFGITVNGAFGCAITGNAVFGAADIAIELALDRYSVVSGNTIRGPGQYGISVNGLAAEENNTNIIANNSISGTASAAILAQGFNENQVIANNAIQVAFGKGIMVDSDGATIISGNLLDGAGVGTIGIDMQSTSVDSLIYGNVLRRWATAPVSGTRAGDLVYGNFSDAAVPSERFAIGTGTSPTTLLKIAASTTGHSQINLPAGPAPTSPADGDIWREDNTNTGLKIRVNGVTKTVTLS